MHPNYSFTISQVVAAADDNMAIGRDGQLLWHLPEDLRYFKNLTWAMPVIMGRKTFDSIGKPLPGRTNIILSRSATNVVPGIQYATTIDEALAQVSFMQSAEVFIIGGGEIYDRLMPFTDRIYLTRVFANITDADTFYPFPVSPEWRQLTAKKIAANERNAYDMQFEVWERSI